MSADRAYERRWWTLVVLSLCLIVITIDNTVLNVALPSIVRDLHASGSELQWMIDAYTLVFACLLLTAGALGDRYGRRKALVFGLVWFAFFSALAATATSPTMVIGARALMGIGGAFIFPTTLSILTNTFHDPAERARAIGVWAGVAGVGVALGPIVGGLLVEHFGWSSVFLINVPVCTACAFAARGFIPESSARDESPLDPVGAGLSILGLFLLLLAIIEAPDKGWLSPFVLGGFLLGVLGLTIFAWWEHRNPRPMLDVKFFRNPRFSAASATITLAYFALFASTFLLTQYFQFLLGYSPLEAGLMLTPVAIGLMVGGPLAPRFVARHGTTKVVVAGLCVAAFATACYASDTIMSSFGLGLLVRLIYGLGMAATVTPVTESIMGSLPPERAGVGSAVNDTTRQTGGALGVAVLGSLFLALYHSHMDGSKLSPTVLRASRDSIGVSLQEAHQLGGPAGAQLREVARQSFLASSRVTFTCAAVIILGAALLARRFLPARAAASAQQPPSNQQVRAAVFADEPI
jgi:EmrB/QacA subfamily drug resistance transporter